MTRRILFVLLIVGAGCQSQQAKDAYTQQFRRRVDAAAEARIDSANAAIQYRCDSLLQFQVPLLADSIVTAIQDSIKNSKPITNAR